MYMESNCTDPLPANLSNSYALRKAEKKEKSLTQLHCSPSFGSHPKEHGSQP